MTEDNKDLEYGLTTGEARIRTKFNPGNNPQVTEIKTRCSELIDLIERIYDGDDHPEAERLKSLAMTSIEEAAMWAVKAATS